MRSYAMFSKAGFLTLTVLITSATTPAQAEGAIRVLHSDRLLFAVSENALCDGQVETPNSEIDFAPKQTQQPSIVEQNRLVSAKDAINGADWLKRQGVKTGLDQLDLGADSKGKRIKFQITSDGTGVQIKLTGSGLDNTLAGDKKSGPLWNRKRNDAKGSSGLTITDLLGPKFAPYDPESKSSMEEKSASRTTSIYARLNELTGGGRDHYLKGTNLYPSDLRTIEQNAPVIKLLAADKSDEASKLYATLYSSASDTDLGTSDPAKLALIQNLNTTLDNLAAQEQAGAKTLHFKAENGNVIAHLNDQQTANIENVIQSIGSEKLFRTGQVTFAKDSNGKGLVVVDSSMSSQDVSNPLACLKIAIDTGDTKKVEAYQKYKGLSDLNLPRR